MLPTFESATAALPLGELSGLVDTESGTHVILRTGPAGYRASHILVKHENSRRRASWRDPEGAVISKRTRDEAVEVLRGCLARLHGVSSQHRPELFAGLARAESDCGSAEDGAALPRWHSSPRYTVTPRYPDAKAGPHYTAGGGERGAWDMQSSSFPHGAAADI
jgi:hypothetical protein